MSTHRIAVIGSAAAFVTAAALWSSFTPVLARGADGAAPSVKKGDSAVALPQNSEPQLAGPFDIAARAAAFLAGNPQLHAQTWEGYTSVYGFPFSNGNTPFDSVEDFRKNSLPMFGMDGAELVSGARHLPVGVNSVPLMPDGQGG